jgi:hypothetical protein
VWGFFGLPSGVAHEKESLAQSEAFLNKTALRLNA